MDPLLGKRDVIDRILRARALAAASGTCLVSVATVLREPISQMVRHPVSDEAT